MSGFLADFDVDECRAVRHGLEMKRLLIWYLPQAALFFGGVYFASQHLPPGSSGYGMTGSGLLLAAAYTGAVNLIIDLLDWKTRRAQRQ